MELYYYREDGNPSARIMGVPKKAKRRNLHKHLSIQLYLLFYHVSKYWATSMYLPEAVFREN